MLNNDKVLEIGLSSWIIQDGNYDDFSVDVRYEFAVEFVFSSLEKSEVFVTACKRIDKSKYLVNAKIIYVGDDHFVIDCGFRTYYRSKIPQNIGKDDWISGEINFGIDPHFYAAYWHGKNGIPNLLYKFRITKIELIIEIDNSISWWTKGSGAEFKSILATNAWEDLGGDCEYILHCIIES